MIERNLLSVARAAAPSSASWVEKAARDDDVEALLIAAVFHLADGNSVEADELFTKASLKDAEAVKAARAELAGHLHPVPDSPRTASPP